MLCLHAKAAKGSTIFAERTPKTIKTLDMTSDCKNSKHKEIFFSETKFAIEIEKL